MIEEQKEYFKRLDSEMDAHMEKDR